MRRFWGAILLLVIWCGISNSFSIINIACGIIVAIVIQQLVIPGKLSFSLNPFALVYLLIYVIYELLISSIEVAWEVITPKKRSQSVIIKLPLDCQSAAQVSLLANIISLTPGTLAVELEEDNHALIMHVMFGQNEEKFIKTVKKQMEPLVMKVLRHDPL
ncbi:MAG: hypothetical protein CMF50_07280 [Legionellales bacterium]|nr:hypothetical protein [Legionellales bacterium]|tara:strand:+ start:45301 stop:45780 length:480 start_codon:yes stop_codon:yes gene_type:complete